MGHAAVRIRLEVNNLEADLLLRAAGARRFAHNWAIEQIKANADQWHAEGTYGVERAGRVKPLTYFILTKMWVDAKPSVAPWADEHSAWTFLYGIRAAAEAHTAFLQGKRSFPKFKARRSDRVRFTVRGSLQLEAGRLWLPVYGWLRIASSCAAQAKLRRLLRRERARLRNITVSRKGDGRWYATVCFEQHERAATTQPAAPTAPAVGIDRGVKVSAVAATRDRQVCGVLPGIRALRDARRKVAHLQRNLARTQKGSANRRKALSRLGKAHAKVAAVRADATHKYTARIAREYGVIVLEDLAVRNLLRNRHLAAAIADQGWGELARQLQYKTARHGGVLIVADRWFASSKTCSCCGWVRPKLSLAERTYHCENPACHLVADRDANAAANLAAWGEAQLAGRTQVGDRHPGGPSGDLGLHACGGSSEPVATSAGAPSEAGTSRSHICVT